MASQSPRERTARLLSAVADGADPTPLLEEEGDCREVAKELVRLILGDSGEDYLVLPSGQTLLKLRLVIYPHERDAGEPNIGTPEYGSVQVQTQVHPSISFESVERWVTEILRDHYEPWR